MSTDNEQTLCKNCGGVIKTEGHIYWPLMPSMMMLFGFIARKGFCDECASKLNGIGILSTMLVFVFLVIGFAFIIG